MSLSYQRTIASAPVVRADRHEAATKRIVLAIAVMLPLAACGKEQPKKVEIRPVSVTSVQHALSGDTISLTGHIQA